MNPGGFNTKFQTYSFVSLLVLILLCPLFFDLLVPAKDESRFIQFSNYASSINIYSELFQETKSPDIVFFGNSSGISSIYPKDIEDEINKTSNSSIRIVNLSITGNSLAIPYLLVESLIKLGKKPKYFIYIPPAEKVDLLHPSSRNLINLIEHFDLLHDSSLGSGNFAKIYAIKTLDILSTLLHYLTNWDIRIDERTQQQVQQNKGSYFFGNAKINFEKIQIDSNLSRSYFNNRETINAVDSIYSESQLAWLNLLTELCSENDIKLVYLMFPFTKEDYLHDKLNLPAAILQKATDIQTIGISRKDLEDGLSSNEYQELNKDPSHFSKDYARLHTKWIIPQIKELLKSEIENE